MGRLSSITLAGREARKVAAFVTELTPLRSKAEEALQRANDELERKVAERTAALESEVAERKRMESSLRELTGRLLTTQDQERRHMARELHDNAGQTLAALSMNLPALETACGGVDSPPRWACRGSEAAFRRAESRNQNALVLVASSTAR